MGMIVGLERGRRDKEDESKDRAVCTFGERFSFLNFFFYNGGVF